MTDGSQTHGLVGKDRPLGTSTRIGHLLGMGMGMAHLSEGPHPYFSPTHMVYGDSLVDRHEWRYTVYLLEFLMTSDWQKKIVVNPPTEDDSDETRSELKQLKDKQEHEGRIQRKDEIIAEDNDYVGLFENLGYFDAHSHPVTSDLVRIVDEIGWAVVQYYKQIFRRPRPSYLDPTIRPMIRVPMHPSYPSGHATQAHLIKEALTDVFNSRGANFEEELRRVAARIGANREWAGVHYRSDTEAGEKLASAIWGLITRNANFQELIEAAKIESRRPLYRLLEHLRKE